ncbi:hypothetical protein BLOT_003066 [Blomia tropicalis]|nr:hypothetical protein BLOT_003066 [Blomia tropicalis]
MKLSSNVKANVAIITLFPLRFNVAIANSGIEISHTYLYSIWGVDNLLLIERVWENDFLSPLVSTNAIIFKTGSKVDAI